MPETTKGKCWLMARALGVAAIAGLATYVTQQGIEHTPLAALPPTLKVVLAIAAPVIRAWLAQSPIKAGYQPAPQERKN